MRSADLSCSAWQGGLSNKLDGSMFDVFVLVSSAIGRSQGQITH